MFLLGKIFRSWRRRFLNIQDVVGFLGRRVLFCQGPRDRRKSPVNFKAELSRSGCVELLLANEVELNVRPRFPVACGCLLLFGLPVLASLDARPSGGSRFVEERLHCEQVRDYLAGSGLRTVLFADLQASGEVSRTQIPQVSAVPLFTEFLDQMQKLRLEALEKQAEEPKVAAGPLLLPEDANRKKPQRETIAATSPYIENQAAFPRPPRNMESFDDIYLYFPVETGDLQKLGLVQGTRHSFQFNPPAPSTMKSRAVLERIHR